MHYILFLLNECGLVMEWVDPYCQLYYFRGTQSVFEKEVFESGEGIYDSLRNI